MGLLLFALGLGPEGKQLGQRMAVWDAVFSWKQRKSFVSNRSVVFFPSFAGVSFLARQILQRNHGVGWTWVASDNQEGSDADSASSACLASLSSSSSSLFLQSEASPKVADKQAEQSPASASSSSEGESESSTLSLGALQR